MIVNAVASGWEVIYQRAHEQLALQLALNWQPKYRSQRWVEVLSAIGDHDNEQAEWHGSFHLNTAGAPLDFSQKPIQHKQIEEVVDAAQYKSRYVATLISLHTQYLYSKAAQEDAALATILEQQAQERKRWLSSLKITKTDAQKDYQLMHWCDRCSLILCRNQIPEDERKVDIFTGPDERMYQLWQRDSGSLAVEPWPFAEEKMEVRVEARYLKKLKFKNDAELAEALSLAKVEEKVWQFKA